MAKGSGMIHPNMATMLGVGSYYLFLIPRVYLIFIFINKFYRL